MLLSGISELDREAMRQFGDQPLDFDMIMSLHAAVINAVPAPQTTTLVPSLEKFIRHVVTSTRVPVLILMSTLVYLKRLEAGARTSANFISSNQHLVFLVALILAHKTLEDYTHTLRFWCKSSSLRAKNTFIHIRQRDVEQLERDILHKLEWNLSISDADLCGQLDGFLEPIRRRILRKKKKQQRQTKKKKRHSVHVTVPGNLNSERTP